MPISCQIIAKVHKKNFNEKEISEMCIKEYLFGGFDNPKCYPALNKLQIKFLHFEAMVMLTK